MLIVKARRLNADWDEAKVLTPIPMGRLGNPDEVAACVSWLVSEDAGFVTGAFPLPDRKKVLSMPMRLDCRPNDQHQRRPVSRLERPATPDVQVRVQGRTGSLSDLLD